MERNEINLMYKLFRELYEIITIKDSVNGVAVTAHNTEYAIPKIKNIIDVLKEISTKESDDSYDTLVEIKIRYNSIYPPKGGFNEFYVWSDDYAIRKMINEKFGKIKREINHLLDAID